MRPAGVAREAAAGRRLELAGHVGPPRTAMSGKRRRGRKLCAQVGSGGSSGTSPASSGCRGGAPGLSALLARRERQSDPLHPETPPSARNLMRSRDAREAPTRPRRSGFCRQQQLPRRRGRAVGWIRRRRAEHTTGHVEDDERVGEEERGELRVVGKRDLRHGECAARQHELELHGRRLYRSAAHLAVEAAVRGCAVAQARAPCPTQASGRRRWPQLRLDEAPRRVRQLEAIRHGRATILGTRTVVIRHAVGISSSPEMLRGVGSRRGAAAAPAAAATAGRP